MCAVCPRPMRSTPGKILGSKTLLNIYNFRIWISHWFWHQILNIKIKKGQRRVKDEKIMAENLATLLINGKVFRKGIQFSRSVKHYCLVQYRIILFTRVTVERNTYWMSNLLINGNYMNWTVIYRLMGDFYIPLHMYLVTGSVTWTSIKEFRI